MSDNDLHIIASRIRERLRNEYRPAIDELNEIYLELRAVRDNQNPQPYQQGNA